MHAMTWFWRLVCTPECSEDCQTNCPGCQELAAEWQAQGRATACDCHDSCGVDGDCRPRLSRWQRAHILIRCWAGSVTGRIAIRLGLGPAIAWAAGRTESATSAAPPDAQAVKAQVRLHYDAQAMSVKACGDDLCCPALPAEVTSAGLHAPADLAQVPAQSIMAALGCGNPLAHAQLQPGDVVLDLGAGGGMDAFVAAGHVGPEGHVYGLDMADEMLGLARTMAVRVGAPNVDFIRGEMEAIPLPDASVDVIISNCVLNLSPDKPRALREAMRVLRPGGRLVISDIITRRPLPAPIRHSLTAWAACIGGALSENECREHLRSAGFTDIVIERERDYTADDAKRTGLGPLVDRYGPLAMAMVGFGSGSIRATKPADGSRRALEPQGAIAGIPKEATT